VGAAQELRLIQGPEDGLQHAVPMRSPL